MPPLVVLSAVVTLGVAAQQGIPLDRLILTAFVEIDQAVGPEKTECAAADAGLRRNSGAGSGLRLRVHNNANVESDTLIAAMKRVEFVYSRIGIRTRWTLVEPAMDAGLLLLDVVIANRTGPTRVSKGTIDEVIGEAVREGYRAYAHYDRITEAASVHRMFRGHLLADVIAHEVGHLLLGGRPHARTGIMRVDIQTGGLPRTFELVEADLIRRRILEGRAGRPLVPVPCAQPIVTETGSLIQERAETISSVP